MKNKKLIIFASFLAVLICLIIAALLFFAVPPGFLVILSFAIGVVTGVCIASFIYYLANNLKSGRLKNEA